MRIGRLISLSFREPLLLLDSGQALVFGGGADVIVVTTNTRHLRQFVDARLWNEVSA
jgi:hypothetical protein